MGQILFFFFNDPGWRTAHTLLPIPLAAGSFGGSQISFNKSAVDFLSEGIFL